MSTRATTADRGSMAQDTATMAGKVTLSDIFLGTFTPEDGWSWCLQQEHWTAGARGANSLAMMARRMASKLGDSGGLGTWECIFPGPSVTRKCCK